MEIQTKSSVNGVHSGGKTITKQFNFVSPYLAPDKLPIVGRIVCKHYDANMLIKINNRPVAPCFVLPANRSLVEILHNNG
jgi:hypothetical protein